MRNSIACVLVLFCSFAYSQKKVSADVEIKQVTKGKVVTVKKSIYYQTSGRLVVHFTVPEEYFVITNSFGEAKVYIPSRNEATVFKDSSFSSKNELLYYFLTNKVDDLGLKGLGFTLASTKADGKIIVKTYLSNKKEHQNAPKIEMAYENNLPIYCAYFNPKGEIIRKIYYSNYAYYAQFVLPTRITDISYHSPNDSIVKREIYSNIQIDGNNSLFEYEIPASAKFIETTGKTKK